MIACADYSSVIAHCQRYMKVEQMHCLANEKAQSASTVVPDRTQPTHKDRHSGGQMALGFMVYTAVKAMNAGGINRRIAWS